MSAAARRLQAAQAANADTAARAAVAAPRIGIVDGYDPSTYSIKVRIQPEDTLTGWLPLKAVVAGNGWGILAPPKQGAQVEVTFEGGDVQLGRVQGCYFSDEDRPPQGPNGTGPQAGQVWHYDDAGASLRLPNTGKVAADGAMGVSGAVHSTQVVTSAGAPSAVVTTSTGDVLHVQDGTVTVGAGGVVNSVWFAAALARMEAAESCAEVQSTISQAFGSIAQLENEITSKLAALQPYLALLHPPTDLASLLTWVQKLITVLIGPQAAAYTQLIAQEAALASEVASFVSAVENLPHECSVTIPTLPGVTLPTP